MDQCNNVAKNFTKPIHEKLISETASEEVYVILIVWLLINWLLNIAEQFKISQKQSSRRMLFILWNINLGEHLLQNVSQVTLVQAFWAYIKRLNSLKSYRQ